MLKNCILAAAALALSAAVCSAADTEGVSGAQFLRIGVGARASALGETGAVSSGAQSMFYNPAGLSEVENTEAAFSEVKWVMDTNYSNLALAKKIGGGVYGFSVSYFSLPSTTKYDNLGNKLSDSYSAADMAAALGCGLPLGGGTSLGLNLKYISSKLDDNTAAAVAGDAGLKWAAVPGALDFGVALQNAGARLKYRSVGDALPLNLKIGGGYTYKIEDETEMEKSVSVFTDLNYLKDSGAYGNLGVEFASRYSSDSSFALRGGYRTNAGGNAGMSFGLGISGPSYLIDYAYSPMGDLGQAHRLTLSLKFGGGTPEPS